MPDLWPWNDHERDDPHDHSHDFVRWSLGDLLYTRHVRLLLQVAHEFIGHEAYATGFYVGLGLAAADAARSLIELVRTLVLADVYGVLFDHSVKAHVVRAFNYSTIKLAARLVSRDWGIRHSLEEAHERREALIAEVKEVLRHPGDALRALPVHLRAEYHEKWQRLQAMNQRTDVADRYEAGKYFGQVVGELVLTIGGLLELGVVTGELAARAPTLLRLARDLTKNAVNDMAHTPPPPTAVPMPEPTDVPKLADSAPVAPGEPYVPPQLTQTGGREMFREALGNLKRAPPE